MPLSARGSSKDDKKHKHKHRGADKNSSTGSRSSKKRGKTKESTEKDRSKDKEKERHREKRKDKGSPESPHNNTKDLSPGSEDGENSSSYDGDKRLTTIKLPLSKSTPVPSNSFFDPSSLSSPTAPAGRFKLALSNICTFFPSLTLSLLVSLSASTPRAGSVTQRAGRLASPKLLYTHRDFSLATSSASQYGNHSLSLFLSSQLLPVPVGWVPVEQRPVDRSSALIHSLSVRII